MSVLSIENIKQVQEQILAESLIKPEDLNKYKSEAEVAGQPLFGYLVHHNLIDDEDLTRIMAKVQGVPYVNLTEVTISSNILKLLDRDIAERYMAVPLGITNNRLAVAMLDAGNVQAVDFLANKIGQQLTVYMASETGIRGAHQQYGRSLDESIGESFKSPLEQVKESKTKTAEEEIKTIVEDSPISKALSAILEYAVKNRASDIHIEPTENDVKIRVRIDGILRQIMRLPKTTEAALISRIKILSTLKIDEHRIPQDGQFVIRIENKEVDLRIAISPVVWGEQVVIRLLDKSGTNFQLESLGLRGHALKTVREGIAKPNGMIITAGPTGSGKSTTLYALIQAIKNDTINIVTLEDPVEYKIEGVNQIQVNNDVGLTFATGLRSILRQDPDVVMVGEIRDQETASLAIQSALTGHLVFSTLHTNSASGVLPRLLDMGVEPFLIASTVNTIIGQRLVRTLADSKEKYTSTKVEAESIEEAIGLLLPKDEAARAQAEQALGFEDLPLASQNAYTLYKGKDSKSAPGGYQGRMGLYEVIEVNETIEEMIMERTTSGAILRTARQQGTITMRQDGYLKALAGLTTLQEVNRVAALGSE